MLLTSSVKLNKLQSLIENKIQHSYIDENIGKPAIDDKKLALLYTTLKQASLPNQQVEQYILSTMFVQMALNVHEIVPLKNNNNENNSNQKKRQLKVLAGDYYSGLYYSLLSETEDYAVIHILATAIKEINEHKMKLYYDNLSSFEEAIDLLMKIESLLTTRIINHCVKLPDIALIENIIILNKLVHEKNLLARNDSTPIFENIKFYASENKLELQHRLDKVIQGKIKEIESSISTFPKQNDLEDIFHDILDNDTTIVKEG